MQQVRKKWEPGQVSSNGNGRETSMTSSPYAMFTRPLATHIQATTFNMLTHVYLHVLGFHIQSSGVHASLRLSSGCTYKTHALKVKPGSTLTNQGLASKHVSTDLCNHDHKLIIAFCVRPDEYGTKTNIYTNRAVRTKSLEQDLCDLHH